MKNKNNKNKGDSKMSKTIAYYDIQKSVRRDWGNVHPATKAFKSKKAYNRKDKSWKNGDY